MKRFSAVLISLLSLSAHARPSQGASFYQCMDLRSLFSASSLRVTVKVDGTKTGMFFYGTAISPKTEVVEVDSVEVSQASPDLITIAGPKFTLTIHLDRTLRSPFPEDDNQFRQGSFTISRQDGSVTSVPSAYCSVQ